MSTSPFSSVPQVASYSISAAKNAKTGKKYTYTDAEWAAWYEKKAARKGTAKKFTKRSYAKNGTKRSASSYRRRAGYSNVSGQGPYYIQGGLNIDGLGSLKGGYYSSDYNHKVLTGSGPYLVKRNSLTGSIDVNSETPIIHNSKTGEAVIISNHEYLGELTSASLGTPSEFKLQSWAINPGNPALFPWLSAIAQNFQEYEIRGMIAYVKTMSTDYSSTVQLGTVFGASDYNVYNSDPSNKQQVEMLEYSNSCKPSRSLVLPIECEPANNGNTHKYIAMNGNYGGGDMNLYDWGHLYIGSQGLPANDAPIGEIWITYEVAFFKPILKQNTGDPLYHCLAADYTWSYCSAASQWGTPINLKEGYGFSSRYVPANTKIFEVMMPVMEDDYVYQLVYTEMGDGVVGTDYTGPVILWSTGGGYVAPLDYKALSGQDGLKVNLTELRTYTSFIHVEYVKVPANTTCMFIVDASTAAYNSSTIVGKTLIIQGFNAEQCGYMLIPADGSPPPVLGGIKSLMPEDHLKALFIQWMKEQRSDSSSSEDEEKSEEIENVIKRLQDRLAEHKSKKQVTFS